MELLALFVGRFRNAQRGGNLPGKIRRQRGAENKSARVIDQVLL